jgi:hypothetical protein
VDRKPLLVVSTGVFVGGVLCTLSAWIIGFDSFVIRVRAGTEGDTFPRLDYLVSVIYEISNKKRYQKITWPACYGHRNSNRHEVAA